LYYIIAAMDGFKEGRWARSTLPISMKPAEIVYSRFAAEIDEILAFDAPIVELVVTLSFHEFWRHDSICR
jgi:hypothetical protein